MKNHLNALLALFCIQFFADAGSNVNATGSMVDAYEGTVTPRTDANGMDPELKAFYDTELLENAKPEMYYAQFGKKQTLPRNHGGKVEWRKINRFPRADKLVEGVIPAGKDFGVTNIIGSVDQYGIYTAITDRLETHAYDDLILAVTVELSSSAAETQEALIRNALLTGRNVLYCDNITLATGAVAGTPTSCATMEASATTMSKLTPAMINKAATIMQKNRAPRIRGRYYAVVHPSVAYDLRECEGWIEAHKYASPGEIFNGEIGELHGVRFISNEFAPVLKTVGTTNYKNKADGATYATYFFGADSFGMIDPEGGGLEVIVHQKGEIGGPLDQFSTVGYKLETDGATILYPERVLRVMSCSSFSATDESNY